MKENLAEKQFKVETKKEKGSNIRIDIELERHGKKDSLHATRISNPEEIKQFAKYQNLKDYDYIGIRTTPAGRAVHTAVSVLEGYLEKEDIKKKINVRARNLPTMIFSKANTEIKKIMGTEEDLNFSIMAKGVEDHYLNAAAAAENPKAREEAMTKSMLNSLEEDKREIAVAIRDLETGNSFSPEAEEEMRIFREKYEKEEGVSMLEIILRAAKYYKNHIDLAGRLDNGSKVFLKEENHSGIIEPLLIHLLGDQIEANPVNPEGKTTLEKLGGTLEPSERVKISIQRISNAEPVIIEFGFRGKRYSLEINGKDDILTKSVKLLEKIGIATKVLERKRSEFTKS